MGGPAGPSRVVQTVAGVPSEEVGLDPPFRDSCNLEAGGAAVRNSEVFEPSPNKRGFRPTSPDPPSNPR